MPVSVNVSETAVPVGAAGTAQQVRNIIATVLINGVATPVMMQVVALADQNGAVIDMALGARLDAHTALLMDIRRESMIQTCLLAQLLNATNPLLPQIDVNSEYRANSDFNLPV